MNKEFMALSKDDIIVTDENSHITKRPFDSKEILLAENKVEIATNDLADLTKKLDSQENVIFLSKSMIAISFIITTLVALLVMIIGGVSHAENFINYAIYLAAKSVLELSIITVPTILYFSIAKAIYKKKSNKTKLDINIAKTLIKEYQEELNALKEKERTVDEELTINTPFSLIEETHELEKEINEDFNELLNSNAYKLVLRKKNLK